jgi:AcrR family transcriptional regulator
VPKRRGPNAGADTRDAVLAAARRLFTARGYDATSMRDVAAEVGITNAALYYHFPGKDALLEALSAVRRAELDGLLAWAREQEPSPGLLRETALRWVDSATQDRLEGMRLGLANRPALARAVPPDATVPGGVENLVSLFVEDGDGGADGDGDGDGGADGDGDPARRLEVRLVFDAFTCAGLAASPEDDLETIKAVARRMVLALTEDMGRAYLPSGR